MCAMKKGTRLTDNPKDTMLRIRVDKETLIVLDKCVKDLNSNRSEVIRQGISLVSEMLNQRK